MIKGRALSLVNIQELFLNLVLEERTTLAVRKMYKLEHSLTTVDLLPAD